MGLPSEMNVHRGYCREHGTQSFDQNQDSTREPGACWDEILRVILEFSTGSVSTGHFAARRQKIGQQAKDPMVNIQHLIRQVQVHVRHPSFSKSKRYDPRSTVAPGANDHWHVHVIAPCGNCRQMMKEMDGENLHSEVILDRDKTVRLEELLPYHDWWKRQ